MKKTPKKTELTGGSMETTYAHNQTGRKPIINIILYLLLSFPLSLIYFILVVTGLSLSASLLILWIGLPLLVGIFAMIRGIGAIERSLVRELLGVSIAAPAPNEQQRSLWRTGLANLRNPLTWKYLLYILLKFPIDIISFTITVALLSISLALILAPLGYAIATFVLQINGIHLHNDTPVWASTLSLNINGTYEPLMFAKAFIFTGMGIAFWFLAHAILRGMATMYGALAAAFLSSIESHADISNTPYTLPNQYAQRYEHNQRHNEPAHTFYDTREQPQATYQEAPEM
jgi:hypothetical protein